MDKHKIYEMISKKIERIKFETPMRKLLNFLNMDNWEDFKYKNPGKEYIKELEDVPSKKNECTDAGQSNEDIGKEPVLDLEQFMVACNARLAHQDEMRLYGIEPEDE